MKNNLSSILLHLFKKCMYYTVFCLFVYEFQSSQGIYASVYVVMLLLVPKTTLYYLCNICNLNWTFIIFIVRKRSVLKMNWNCVSENSLGSLTENKVADCWWEYKLLLQKTIWHYKKWTYPLNQQCHSQDLTIETSLYICARRHVQNVTAAWWQVLNIAHHHHWRS